MKHDPYILIQERSHDFLDASHDSTCPPPLPSSPPPDL